MKVGNTVLHMSHDVSIIQVRYFLNSVISGCRKLTEIITERRMKMAGHILRRPDTRHSKYVILWNIEGKRKKGRPKRIWRKTFQEDLERVIISINDAENTARDRRRWRQLAAQCAMSHRRN